jgi:hypothetical protein
VDGGPAIEQGGSRHPFLRGRLRDSVRHADELRLASAYQAPRSILLGRRRRAVTSYTYDEETGRLARAVTVWDPEWTPQDRAWAQAHLEEQAATCRGCGHPLAETTQPGAEGRYRVPPPVICHACRPLEIAERKWREVEGGPGALFHVERDD